jgi:hypothetical protein
MMHADFVVWMLLYPVSVSLCRYLDPPTKEESEQSTLMHAIFWFGIGALLL